MARPKKTHRFTIKSFKNRGGTTSWRVSGTCPDGSRVRQNLSTKADAVRLVADLELKAEDAEPDGKKLIKSLLTPEQLAEAETATGLLGGRGLADSVSHYIRLRSQAAAKGLNLDQALAFVASRYRPETRSASVLNAKAEYLASRAGISDSTRSNYETGLGLLLKPDPNKPVHEFSVQDLEILLKDYSNPHTQRSFRTIFSGFFRWCVRHHYCLENPCDRFDKLQRDMSQIAALSLDECKRLLHAAMHLQDGAAAATVAIGLFAGLRPSEIRDLKPADIGREKIRVSGGKLRRTLKRSVPIAPVLAVWLEEFPFEGLPAGWDGKLKKLKKATKAKKWVHDIIRHTSITFQTERDKNEALTAYNCGTSIQMMNRHYRDTIDDERSIAGFWCLTPEKLRSEPPEVDMEIRKRVDWPDRANLKKIVWNKPLVHAAKDIGVSDVALRKRCIKLGIALPRQGHWIARG